MLSVFICDYEEQPRNATEKIVETYICIEAVDSVMQLALSTDSPHKILDYVKKNKTAGLYFLAFDLQCNMNGIELAAQIRKLDPRAFIVFITSHTEALPLALQYKVEALDFIAKDDPNLAKRICACLADVHKKYTTKATPLQKNFSFTIAGKVTVVDCNEIIYFEASKFAPHKIVLYTENASYHFWGILREIEKQLDNDFLKCHRSYIVNLKKVVSTDPIRKIVHLMDGSKCLVSTKNIDRITRMANL